MDEQKIEQEPKKDDSPFQPSIFNQMDLIRQAEGIRTEPEFKVDAEDLKYLCKMPFDLTATFTGCEQVKLSENESNQLSKLWKNPIERLAKKYPAIQDMDIYLACTVTLGIIAEKGFAYRIYKQSNNDNTGDAGKGKDELLKNAPSGY